jgi:hypothetical protein
VLLGIFGRKVRYFKRLTVCDARPVNRGQEK